MALPPPLPKVQTSIDPRTTNFRPWANAMRLQNSSLPVAPDESGWQGWAAQVLQFEPNAPDPRHFKDWRAWATAWLQAV